MVEGDGNVYVAETQFALTEDGQGYECVATFTGAAGGISVYALLAVTVAGPASAAGLPSATGAEPEVSPSAAPAGGDGNGTVWIVVGAVAGALALGLAGVAAVAVIARHRRESRYGWRGW